MLQTFLTVQTSEFYKTFDKVGGFMIYVVIGLFVLMLLYATVKYVKR